MNQRTALLSLMAVAALLVTGGPARASTETRPGAGRWADNLATHGVTDEQKSQIHAILRRDQPSLQPLIQDCVTARRGLRDLIRAVTVDEVAIRAQAAKLGSLEADLAVKRAQVAHELRAVLTPAQIEKLKGLQAAADTRVDGWRERVAKRIAGE